METLSLIGIFLGLGLLMYLAFKGLSIVWIAPLCAGLVAIMGGMDIITTYMGPYMEGLVGFMKSWFPAFMLSAIFGNLMDQTGCAESIAVWLVKRLGSKSAIASIVIGCGVLTYGGVSLFVVVFAIYPLALAIFREANISRKLIPGCIALGAFTFTMTAIPGTPQIQNLIPMKYFGTTPSAAPIMGIAGALVMFVLGVLYMEWRKKKRTAEGDVFTEPDAQHAATRTESAHLPNVALAIIPLIMVVVVLNFLQPALKLFSADLVVPSPNIIIIALLVGIGLVMLLNLDKRAKFLPAISKGAQGSIGAILNTSAAVGFGTVVRAVPGFAKLTELIMGVPGTPLISLAVAVNILAGATGSASGGMGIALEALGAKYMELSAQTGIPAGAFHRIAAMSSGGLDSLPHNGAVLTLLNKTGMTHKDSYMDIFIVSVIMPIFATIIAMIISGIGLV